MRSAVTVSLVPEARGGPFVFWDNLAASCEAAASLGFDAIELFPPDFESLPVPDVEALLTRFSLKIAAVGTGAGWLRHKLRLTDPDEAVRARAHRFVVSAIRFAGSLGAPVIIGSMQGRWGEGTARDQALAWLAEALSDLSAESAATGQVLLYEPLNRYETNLFNRVADANEFLDRSALENVRLLCDLFHMNIEEADLGQSLRLAGSRLGHVHLADSNRLAAGLGHTDFEPVAAALRDVCYDGYLSAEVLPLPDSDTAARQTMRSFQKWFQPCVARATE